MAEPDERKSALIAELSRARAELTRHADGLRSRANVPAKLKTGFDRHRGAWLGGAAIIGLALAKVPPRTRKVARGHKNREPLESAGRAGFLVGGLKLALDFAKPLLLAWATKRMGDVVRTSEKVETKVDRVEAKSDEIHRATT